MKSCQKNLKLLTNINSLFDSNSPSISSIDFRLTSRALYIQQMHNGKLLTAFKLIAV